MMRCQLRRARPPPPVPHGLTANGRLRAVDMRNEPKYYLTDQAALQPLRGGSSDQCRRATIAPPRHEGIKNTKGVSGRRFLEGWRADCFFGAEAACPVPKSRARSWAASVRFGGYVGSPSAPWHVSALAGASCRTQNPRSQGNATSEVLLLRPEYRVHRVGVGEISHRPDPTIVVVTLSCVVELA